LMDRINQDDALLAAEQILPVILGAMREQMSGISGLGAVKGGDGGAGADYAGDFLESIWQALDDAELALSLSYGVSLHTRRIEKARYARIRFEEALTELEEAEDRIRALQIWQYSYDRAQGGLVAASERLEDLGE